MTDAKLEFVAPGPGAWEIEGAHFSRPVSRFTQQPIQEGMGDGFAVSTARFGLLLDRISPSFVNDFCYTQAEPFGAPKGAKGPPPKLIFQIITRLIPKLRARIRRSHEAFETKLWREDLKRWDEEVRPASDKRHRELQAIDPAKLSDDELVAHVKVLRDHVRDMVRQHHVFTITCTLPIGDLLVHVHDWTGKPTGEILQVLRGSTKISHGVASGELDALGAALREDAAARALLDGADPARAIEQLEAYGGAVGKAMHAYLEVVRYRCLGYDVATKYAIEMPEVIVGALRSASGAPRKDGGGDPKVATLRDEIPEQHRARFDELVDEARLINRLRDERGHYSDGWATGLARRGLLELGRRLVARGAFDDLELVVDASYDELCALFGGGKTPSRDELRRRATWRASRSVADPDVPPWLGAQPSGPPPAAWLPAHGRRAQRAVDAVLTNLFGEPALARTPTSVKGLPVSPGTYEGPARLVESENEFGRIRQGDVLVTRSTSPYFNVVLPLLGAIVTDRGGQLCHAAIVSREYGIPGVVGTREATKLIVDGARVRVDGTTGVVTVLG